MCLRQVVLCAVLWLGSCVAVIAQDIKIFYHPTESPQEYQENFHYASIEPVGVYGLASFEVNPWVYDQRSNTAYRIMETEGNCALIASFRYYLEFTDNRRLCVNHTISAVETLHIVDVLVRNGEHLLIYSIQDKTKAENTIYTQPVRGDMTLVGEPRRLFTMTGFVDDGLTLVRTSPDKRYIAFIQGDPDYSLNDNYRRPVCTVYDDHFTQVWQRELDLSAYEGTLADIELDNAGNMHILRGTTRRDVQPGLHSYFWRSQKQMDIALGNELHNNFGCKLRIINGIATVAGFYKERRNIGYFIYQADTVTSSVAEVGRVMLADQVNLSRNMVIRDMMAFNTGALVFSAEWDICSASGVHKLCSSGPVTVVSWQGTHRWQRTVYKNQSSNDYSRGYTMVPHGKDVLFIYNDHPDNILKKPADPDVKRYQGTNSVVMMQKLDDAGNASKTVLTIPRGSSRHRLMASGCPPIEVGKLYKVKVLEGHEALDGLIVIE